MAFHYSVPARATEPNTLPDIEVFYHDQPNAEMPNTRREDAVLTASGWYWWSCFPGCLPDDEPVGPFSTETKALADAQY